MSDRPHGFSPYRHALELVTARRSEPISDVTISRNAKGVAQFEVTVRGLDADRCRSEARAIYEQLCIVYPYPDTNGAT